MEHLLVLKTLLQSNDRSVWPGSDLTAFKMLGKSLKRAIKGPLRTIRNKRGAHTDPEGLMSGAVPPSSAENVLLFLGQAACLLLLCLNHEGAFCYQRQPGPTDDHVEVFAQYPLATTFSIDRNRQPEAAIRDMRILQVHLAEDPRHAQSAIVLETLALYNNLASWFSHLPRFRVDRPPPGV